MAVYRVTLNGQLVHQYRHDVRLEFPQWPGCVQDEVPDEPAPSTPPPLERRITKLAFRNRFSQDEKIAIEIAALDAPAQSMQQRAMSAALRASQADVLAAQYIDLGREDTRHGVIALEQAGILSAGRALQILDAAIQDHEVYRG